MCAAIANRVTNEFKAGIGVEEAIKVANEAVKILYEWDQIKEKIGKRYLSFNILMKHWRSK